MSISANYSENLLSSTAKIMQGKNRFQAVREVIVYANDLSNLYLNNKIGHSLSSIVNQAILELGKRND